MAVMGQGIRGVYNVGTGVEASINELFALIKELMNSSSRPMHGPAKKGEQRRSVVDPSTLRKELGWESRVSLREGLVQTIEYFRGALS